MTAGSAGESGWQYRLPFLHISPKQGRLRAEMSEESMKKYIFKRLLTALGIVLFVILLNYVIIHLAPGDPVRIMAGFDNPTRRSRWIL